MDGDSESTVGYSADVSDDELVEKDPQSVLLDLINVCLLEKIYYVLSFPTQFKSVY